MSWINCFAEGVLLNSLRNLCVRLRGKTTSVRDFFTAEAQKTRSYEEDNFVRKSS
jgi:hypothetical protein